MDAVQWNLSSETWQSAPVLGREGDLFLCKALLSLFGYQTELAEYISSHLSNADSPILTLLSQGKEQNWGQGAFTAASCRAW